MSRPNITLTMSDATFTAKDARRWPHRKLRLQTTDWPAELIITRVVNSTTVGVRELRTDLRGWY